MLQSLILKFEIAYIIFFFFCAVGYLLTRYYSYPLPKATQMLKRAACSDITANYALKGRRISSSTTINSKLASFFYTPNKNQIFIIVAVLRRSV